MLGPFDKIFTQIKLVLSLGMLVVFLYWIWVSWMGYESLRQQDQETKRREELQRHRLDRIIESKGEGNGRND